MDIQLGPQLLAHCDRMLQENWSEEYKYAGSFQTALMRCIETADHINLQKLMIVYPNIVRAYCMWAGK